MAGVFYVFAAKCPVARQRVPYVYVKDIDLLYAFSGDFLDSRLTRETCSALFFGCLRYSDGPEQRLQLANTKRLRNDKIRQAAFAFSLL